MKRMVRVKILFIRFVILRKNLKKIEKMRAQKGAHIEEYSEKTLK